jgi:hypothetical protein
MTIKSILKATVVAAALMGICHEAVAQNYFFRSKATAIIAQSDTSPDPVTFQAVTGAVAGAVVETAVVRTSGHDGVAVSISGSGASYRTCSAATCTDQGATGWTTAPGTLAPNGYVQLRMTVGGRNERRVAILALGSLVAEWSVTASNDPPVGVGGYAGRFNGRNIWVNSAEKVGTWSILGAQGYFLAGGTSNDDGAGNTELQAGHARGPENLAATYCRTLQAVNGQKWHLPAYNELRFALAALGEATFPVGNQYWSSTEQAAHAVLGNGNVRNAQGVVSISNISGLKDANPQFRTKCIRYGD